jgi:hypothetical protein
MNRLVSIAALSLISASAFAAAPKFNIMNSSTETLIDNASANAIWHANLSEKIAKLHPVKKLGYISEVSGGFDGKTCVVVARAMSAPLKGKTFVYDPKQAAAAFGSQAGATDEQCKELAKSKLTEAVKSVALSLENS